MKHKMVVIGASAGGLEGIKALIAALPKDFPAVILVVLHIPSDSISALPQILSRAGRLPARQPEDGETIKPGQIYVARPDHHLLVEGDKMGVKKSPRENRFRPSIDVLFRSAAYHHKHRVAGVILSGALEDGVSGLWTIKHLGGTTLVQHPDEAAFDSMPLSALQQVDIDHLLSAADIGTFLSDWATKPLMTMPEVAMEESKRIETEVSIASGKNAFQKGVMELGELSPFSCPECHGVLLRIKEGEGTRYRCHTGHAYTDSALLAGLMESIDHSYGEIQRALEEAVILLEDTGEHLAKTNQTAAAEIFFRKAKEARHRAQIMHDIALHTEHVSSDHIEASEG